MNNGTHTSVRIHLCGRRLVSRPIGEEIHNFCPCFASSFAAVCNGVAYFISQQVSEIYRSQHSVRIQCQLIEVFIVWLLHQSLWQLGDFTKLPGMNAHKYNTLSVASCQIHICFGIIHYLGTGLHIAQPGILSIIRLIISKFFRFSFRPTKGCVAFPDFSDNIIRSIQIMPVLQSILQNCSGGGGMKHPQ